MAGDWWVEKQNAPDGAYLLAGWRGRRDCLTNSLSFQTPVFGGIGDSNFITDLGRRQF